ncbi:MAG: ABC transporter permease [Desulfurococcales archaeon]|nr:ABC transporter permease [Desulfurococcales archaeon]
MTLFKASLRILTKRKIESIVFVIIIFLGVTGIATIKLAADYSLELAGKAWSVEVGNIVIIGDIPYNVTGSLTGLPDVAELKLIKVKTSVAFHNTEPLSVAFVYNPTSSPPIGYLIDQEGSVIIYNVAGEKADLEPGDSITIPGYGSLTIDGNASGIVTISGGTDITLIVPLDIFNELPGKEVDVLAVIASPGANVSNLARTLYQNIVSQGGGVDSINIQTEEDNPAEAPMKSMALAFEVFIGTALVTGALLIAGSEMALLERNLRELGVLKAIGAGKKEIIAYYSGYNIMRGVIGSLLGIMLSIPLSRYLVTWGSKQAGSSTVEILMQHYPYTPSIGVIASIGLFAVGIILLFSIIPPLILSRINTVQALRFTGLSHRFRILKIMYRKVRIAHSVRRILSRPWTTIFLILIIAVSWGATASIPMSIRSVNSMGDELETYGYTAVIMLPTQDLNFSELLEMADKVNGVSRAELWLSMWRGVEVFNETVSTHTCLIGNWTLGPSLIKGHWPGEGEIVVSETMARLYDLDLGDIVYIRNSKGQMLELRVSGIASTHENAGKIVFLNKRDYTALLGERYLYLRISSTDNGEVVGERVVRSLLENSIPAKLAYTKDELIKRQEQGTEFFRTFLSIINISTLITGFAGLAMLSLVDMAGRLKEIGVLRSIGFTNHELSVDLVLGTLIAIVFAAPLAYIVSLLISSSLLRLMVDALGFLEPIPSIMDLANTGWVILLALFFIYLVSLVYLRRQRTSDLLRVE